MHPIVRSGVVDSQAVNTGVRAIFHGPRLGRVWLAVAAVFIAGACSPNNEPENVPPTSSPVLTTAPSEFTTTTTTIPAGPVLYEIQPGDILSVVAEDFGITLEQLLIANPTITDPSLINIGTTIVIPPRPPVPLEGGLELDDPEAPDLPALTSTTSTTEPFVTTSTSP